MTLLPWPCRHACLLSSQIVADIQRLASKLHAADAAVRQAALQMLKQRCDEGLAHHWRVAGLFSTGLVLGVAGSHVLAHHAAEDLLSKRVRGATAGAPLWGAAAAAGCRFPGAVPLRLPPVWAQAAPSQPLLCCAPCLLPACHRLRSAIQPPRSC